MSINLENYEVWLTDYIDGNLSEQEKTLVEHFLSIHPELDIQIEDLILDPILPVVSEKFPDKHILKKESNQVIQTRSINRDNYDEAFIAFHENLLNNNEKIEIEKFIEANPNLINEFKLYGEIKFTPDPEIRFPNKSILKRRTQGRRILWLAPLSAAAAGLALILVFSTNNPSEKNSSQNRQDLIAVTDGREVTANDLTDLSTNNSIDNLNSASKKQNEPNTNLTVTPSDNTHFDKKRTNNQSKLIAEKKAHDVEKPQLSSLVKTRDTLTISKLPSLELAFIELPTRQIINDYQNPIISALRLREKKNTLILAQQDWEKDRSGYTGFKVPNLIKFAEKKLENLTSNNESDFRIKTGRAKSGEVKSFSIGGDFLKISHSSQ